MALTSADKEALAGMINSGLAQIPGFLRGAVNSGAIAGFLGNIPRNFRDYTLQELIEAVEELDRDKKIK
jgi:hypothetical protein